MPRSVLLYAAAAVCEIAGCYAFWSWLRNGQSPWWAIAGLLALVAFAVLLTFVDTSAAGRAYAAYGGIYIGFSIAWLRAVEGTPPDRWDVLGAGICLVGAGVILFGPRA